MTRTTRVAGTAGALLLAIALSAPVAQASRGTGCPKGFTLESVEVLGDDFTGVADNVNHDGLICIKPLKSGGGIFIDNTTP